MIALSAGCIIVSEEYGSISPLSGDYHFMRLDEGVRNHKPGCTLVVELPVEMTPDSEVAWNNQIPQPNYLYA